MNYHVMAEVAKRSIARSIDAACERELAAHREQFKPKPLPIVNPIDTRRPASISSTYDQLRNNLSNPYRDSYAQQSGMGFLMGGW